VDLLPGSPPGSKGEYALVILDCEGRVLIDKRVPAKKLIRLLWEYRPKILALDNVAELGKDRKELVKMLNLMPPETEVVQVTRVNGEFVNLRELARRAGLNVPQNKLDPQQTAYALAVLALKGIGTKLKVFEEKTKIVVTKGRTPRAGGSSMNRFIRATKNAVIETVNEIKEILEKEGLDYDLVMKKSDGSIDSASFTVYAPRKRLEGLIKPVSTSAVRVRIRPVVTRRILFDEEPSEKKYLIVGIDPGIQTGIAIIDLDGNVLHLSSVQNVDRGDIIALINKFGTPLIIATDTNPPTHGAKKLASVLNAELYYPKSSLSIKEKEKIANEYAKKGVRVSDSHQRDALAAAHKALIAIKDKLEKIDSYLDKLNLDVDRNRIRAEVLKGRSLADLVEEEVERLLEEGGVEERGTPPVQRRTETNVKDSIRLAVLEAENVQLQMKLKEAQDEVERLKLELSLLRKEIAEEVERRTAMLKETVKQLSERLKESEKEIEALRLALEEAGNDMLKIEQGTHFLAIYLPIIRFTTEFPLEELETLRRRAIYAKEVEALSDEFVEALKETKTILVTSKVSDKVKEEAEERGVPVLVLEGAKVYGNFAVLPEEVVEEWERREKELRSRKPLSVEEIERILLEYRASRWG